MHIRHFIQSLYFNYFSISILNKTLISNTKNCKKGLAKCSKVCYIRCVLNLQYEKQLRNGKRNFKVLIFFKSFIQRKEINNDVKYYYIELEKFRKQNPDMTKQINHWLLFLDMERRELLEMACEKNEKVRRAVENYEENSIEFYTIF